MLNQNEKKCANKGVHEARILSYKNENIEPHLAQKAYGVAKRVFDIVFSLVSIIMLSPIMLLIAMMVWLDDPHGSPIFVSKRCGRDGKLFNFYKFRSMCVDAEEHKLMLYKFNEADGPVFKIKNDPRITRVGRVIRRINLDELPQLFNVLCGHMSLVGPRPPIPNEVEEYTPLQMKRLSVTPGLTCYWQVQPARNSLSFNEWVELDIKYIYERSMWVDIKLILQTVMVVLKGEGQ